MSVPVNSRFGVCTSIDPLARVAIQLCEFGAGEEVWAQRKHMTPNNVEEVPKIDMIAGGCEETLEVADVQKRGSSQNPWKVVRGLLSEISGTPYACLIGVDNGRCYQCANQFCPFSCVVPVRETFVQRYSSNFITVGLKLRFPCFFRLQCNSQVLPSLSRQP